VNDRKERGVPFSLTVAPVLAAFTLPTIAVVATSHPPPHWQNIILSLFVASTGVLLASFQLAVNKLSFLNRSDPWGKVRWGAIRAYLTGAGLVLLSAGLVLLVWPDKTAANRGILYAGLVVLAAGVGLPMILNFVPEWLRKMNPKKYSRSKDESKPGVQ